MSCMVSLVVMNSEFFSYVEKSIFLQISIITFLGRVLVVQSFSFQHLENTMLLPCAFQSFCWEICCEPYEVSLVCIIYFSLCCSVWVSSIVLSSSSLIHSPTSSSLLLNPSGIFLSVVIVFLTLWLLFVFSLFLEVFTVFTLLPNLVNVFMSIALNLLPGRLLIYVSLQSFS